ncbi:MAG: 4-alpha-glucanotransferase [Spirochaetaceae bacterium]|nr:MAG: 4-alpha-glucanotransferase [Spirochaetaceae bacterium]
MLPHELNSLSTGVLTPVTSLRSERSVGSGEFADLTLLADWVKAAGLNLIQILPVNDTGTDSSPYSAQSAFALHPLYIRLDDLPELSGSGNFANRVQELRTELSGEQRLEYERVLSAKLTLLHELYQARQTEIEKDSELKAWMHENDWVQDYAVFRVLKARNNAQAWWQWEEHQVPSDQLIENFWEDATIKPQLMFYAWIQYRLEQQLRAAKSELTQLGVILKGDIPILMNEDSVDLWRRRDLFRTDLRAGAPPDMFSELGQNWGFPIYDWSELQKSDFGWWRDRVRQAAKFYHAYRIDHVLGFFRIWAIPAEHESGILGRFEPSATLSRAELQAAGFSNDRVRWLAEPHLSGDMLRNALGEESEPCMNELLEQIGSEDLYLFQPQVGGERGIYNARASAEAKAFLVEQYRDRALIKIDDDSYAYSWSFRSCTRYQMLNEDEKQVFEGLVHRIGEENERVWESHGQKTLQMMRETVDILPCAEDLGVVPDSVPEVLGSLGILSLKVPRWTRDYDQADEPFIPPHSYPFLSVCAPSVHDTSTLREWWELELSEEERESFWTLLGYANPTPSTFDPQTAGKVIQGLLGTSSVFCIFQLQDLFTLEPELCSVDPARERVNIPGTANSVNWSYRIPENVEALLHRENLIQSIRKLVDERNQRSIL